jgi:hypothetical protein
MAPAPAKPGDLGSATAACLRLDVFGSNGGRYANKWVYLNGVRIGQVPVTNRDAWVVTAFELSADQIAILKPVNEVVITNEGGDAWKLRNIALALRRPDGTWTRSAVASQVFSTPGWALSEGASFGPDGKAGPIEIRLTP